MAYVVSRPGGRWELRESAWTPKGPRSRTLASFRTLTSDAIERARERARGPLSDAAARLAAHRAGAPVAPTRADRAAAELLRELASGNEPRAAIREVLVAALGGDVAEDVRPSDAAAASAAWLGATPEERGAAVRDLMLVAERIPRRGEPARPRFPTISSSPA